MTDKDARHLMIRRIRRPIDSTDAEI